MRRFGIKAFSEQLRSAEVCNPQPFFVNYNL